MLEDARDLYAVAPEGFIAARNELVKQLKAAGRADDAATVRTLRRPRLAEWALNRLAHTGADTVDRFAHATASAQRAQSAAIGGDPTALRSATAELRDALNAVADGAVGVLTTEGGSGEGQRDDITAILRQLVANADPSPLVAGVVGSEAIVASGEFFPGAPDPVSRPPVPTTERTAAAVTEPTAAAVRAMERAERLGLHQRAESALAGLQAATAAVEHAQAALIEHRRALTAARAAATAAEAALADFDTAHGR